MTGKVTNGAIFIGGYMHSGTTMLHKVVGSHSQVYGVKDESRFFERLSRYKTLENNSNKIYNSILSLFSLSDQEVSYVERNKEYILTDPVRAEHVFNNIATCLVTFHGKSRWVEKTPTNVYHVDTILRNFPGCKVILIYRDIRNIIASKKIRTLTVDSGRFKKSRIAYKKLEKDWNVLADSFSWIGAIKAQARACRKHPEAVYTVSYENFVEDPLNEWRKIIDFLGLSFEEESLAINFKNTAIVQKTRNTGITASETSWQNVLSPAEKILSNAINRKELIQLGYSPDDSGHSRLLVFFYFMKEVPGIFVRLYKRFRLFSGIDFINYTRQLLKRV